MSYLVLARKYRPQKFNEIIGQSHIVTTLKNALKSGKIWHAYIFAGMRGTGKTTTARVLAKAVNCLSPNEDFEPCNNCKNCVEISQGNCIDVIEIDAASNRGIDDIRALRETVKYVPVNCKYKVYIIDEAHQITKDAFNALLKTLEEPPEYIIFILATTEFNSLPLTIVSRCQIFHFRPVSSNEVFKLLKQVVTQEGKSQKITDDALKLISETSTGSVRDGLSLLDQVLSFTEIYEVVNSKIIREILGSTPNEVINKYVELLLEGNLGKIFQFINEVYFSGVELLQFAKDLLEFFHTLFYIKSGIKTDTVYNVELFKDKFSITQVMVAIQQFIHLVEEIKRVDYPKTLFELYTVRLTRQFKDIDEIIKNLQTNQEIVHPDNTIQTLSHTNHINQQELSQSIGGGVSFSQNDVIFDDLELLWEKLLAKIKVEKPLSYPLLAEAEVSICDNTITIFLANKYVQTFIESQKLDLEKIIEQLCGKKFKVCYQTKQQKKVVVGEDLPEVQQPQTPQKVFTIKSKKTTKVDPVVEKIRATFAGKIIDQKTNPESE
ncbi:MAG: DNA polymerase III subunit gamma/tau, partial [Endomicrobia bacterium]|nr:DNA polymerase III subunit gamma/tau [Endomicrobiia bacterium]